MPHANYSFIDQLYAYERAGVQVLGKFYATDCQGEAACTVKTLATPMSGCIENPGLVTIA